jgi:hypothetical protein
VASRKPPSTSPIRVICRYTGAYSRHEAAKRAAWMRATSVSASVARRGALRVRACDTVGYT